MVEHLRKPVYWIESAELDVFRKVQWIQLASLPMFPLSQLCAKHLRNQTSDGFVSFINSFVWFLVMTAVPDSPIVIWRFLKSVGSPDVSILK